VTYRDLEDFVRPVLGERVGTTVGARADVRVCVGFACKFPEPRRSKRLRLPLIRPVLLVGKLVIVAPHHAVFSGEAHCSPGTVALFLSLVEDVDAAPTRYLECSSESFPKPTRLGLNRPVVLWRLRRL
jgi:hypothetical protein